MKDFAWGIGFALVAATATAQEVELEVQPAVRVSFQSQAGKSYQLLSTTQLDRTGFSPVGQALDGSGGRVTLFYDTQQDEKVFFRVEERNASAGQGIASAVVNSGFLTGINVIYGGSGYSESSPPRVTITDGTGSGASASAVVVNGIVTAVTVHAAGNGYSASPTVTIGEPSRPLSAEGLVQVVNAFAFNSTFVGQPFYSNLVRSVSLRSFSFDGVNILRVVCDEVDFTSCNFRSANLSSSRFTNCNFTAGDFSSAQFSSRFSDCNFANATMSNFSAFSSIFENCSFSNAVMVGGHFFSTDLVGTRFDNANLTDATFQGALNFNSNAFTGAIFSNTTLPDGSKFTGSLP